MSPCVVLWAWEGSRAVLVVSALGEGAGIRGTGVPACPSYPQATQRPCPLHPLAGSQGQYGMFPALVHQPLAGPTLSWGPALCLASLWHGLGTGFLQADAGLSPVLTGPRQS